MAILNLCVRIKQFVSRHPTLIVPSLSARRYSIATAVQKLPDFLLKSVSTAGRRLGRCVGRHDQLIDQFEVSQ